MSDLGLDFFPIVLPIILLLLALFSIPILLLIDEARKGIGKIRAKKEETIEIPLIPLVIVIVAVFIRLLVFRILHF